MRCCKTALKSYQNCWLVSQNPNIGAVEGKGLVFTIFWRPEASFKQVCFDSYQVLGSLLMLFSQESPKHEIPSSWLMRSRQGEKSKSTQRTHIIWWSKQCKQTNMQLGMNFCRREQGRVGLHYISSYRCWRDEVGALFRIIKFQIMLEQRQQTFVPFVKIIVLPAPTLN